MSKKKNPTQAETRVSQTSPEAVLRGALQQHPEIRKGLEFLLSQNICTPVLVATLSSKSPATERKSAYEAWERICGTNTLNNRLGDNREKMDVRNQRIVWLTAETSEIVRGVLTDAPEATKKKPTEKVALAKKGGVREKKEVDGFEWGNAFFPEYPHEHNAVLFFHRIYRAGEKGVSRSTAMQDANLSQVNGSKFVDRQIALGLIEDIGGVGKEKGTEKRTPIYRLTDKGRRLQPEIFEHYKKALVEDKEWIKPDGTIA